MLTCQELTELATDYLEGRMDDEERLRFQMHISLCRHCRGFLGQLRTVIATLGQLPEDPMSDEVMAHLVERYRQWHKSSA